MKTEARAHLRWDFLIDAFFRLEGYNFSIFKFYRNFYTLNKLWSRGGVPNPGNKGIFALAELQITVPA